MSLRLVKRLSRDWFLLGMVCAVGLALLFPDFGKAGGAMHADVVTHVGIFAVFFLHGVGMPLAQLKAGALQWRLHVLVQSFTFLVFPALWFAFNLVAGAWVPADVSLGFLFLCAVPSTISSSVAMTGAARGNVAGAIFDASLSSLLGIFFTPLLVGLLAHTTGQSLPLGEAILKLSLLLLLPLVLGQLARPFVGAAFARYRKYTNGVDRVFILVLVYASFCDSFSSGLFSRHGGATLAMVIGGAALLLATVLTLSTLAARRWRFSTEDEIAAVFCGSKKTLASGVPMARLLFGAHPALGLIVLPLMFYHQLQLVVCSVLAERYASRPSGS
ncbi:sodium bile acid symporter family protein [Myxococcus stipitatus DSM 14675]|uniref:Sodium bile acid symporter family protein n=1 Tax=Myxococcus stipitatus (strain DSM 14675 / JCM 12634 / Mx s8) TaxID=1278073 RepID=L7UBX4_MYXSD|nr:bile acid:sodium symporter family protein [Myxococcus stipitatus]AGC45390.1 sodium bile acid symporter family protein [Myxococcus stipitatus DSM 14675]